MGSALEPPQTVSEPSMTPPMAPRVLEGKEGGLVQAVALPVPLMGTVSRPVLVACWMNTFAV